MVFSIVAILAGYVITILVGAGFVKLILKQLALTPEHTSEVIATIEMMVPSSN